MVVVRQAVEGGAIRLEKGPDAAFPSEPGSGWRESWNCVSTRRLSRSRARDPLAHTAARSSQRPGLDRDHVARYERIASREAEPGRLGSTRATPPPERVLKPLLAVRVRCVA